MTVDKNSVILVLVIACGLLAGALIAGLSGPRPVNPAGTVVFTGNAPQPIGPYSQAIQSGDLLFLSGQIGIDPATGTLSGTTGEQAGRAMENLRAVLGASGLGFKDVVQARIYVTNISDFAAVNTIYGSYFNGTYPARTTVGVAALPKGATVEIELVARKGQ